MTSKDNEGILSYIESQGTAKPLRDFTVDELIELMMLFDSSPTDLSEQVSNLLNNEI